ncbi:hypothetical protein BKA57DRAFT_151731 [Linnemannia elongata]|nr:hypothetical protein BKA57DRAFT_151731 [Linnemannia elongata]
MPTKTKIEQIIKLSKDGGRDEGSQDSFLQPLFTFLPSHNILNDIPAYAYRIAFPGYFFFRGKGRNGSCRTLTDTAQLQTKRRRGRDESIELFCLPYSVLCFLLRFSLYFCMTRKQKYQNRRKMQHASLPFFPFPSLSPRRHCHPASQHSSSSPFLYNLNEMQPIVRPSMHAHPSFPSIKKKESIIASHLVYPCQQPCPRHATMATHAHLLVKQ